MTSEHLEDDIGTGLKCHTFGSLAMHLKCIAKVQYSEVVFSHPFPFIPIFSYSFLFVSRLP